jgi:hypothetical protein
MSKILSEAQNLMVEEKFEMAFVLVGQYLIKHPTSSEAIDAYLNAATGSAKCDTALYFINNIFQLDNSNTGIAYALGALLSLSGNRDITRGQIEHEIAKDPLSCTHYYILAGMLFGAGQKEDALMARSAGSYLAQFLEIVPAWNDKIVDSYGVDPRRFDIILKSVVSNLKSRPVSSSERRRIASQLKLIGEEESADLFLKMDELLMEGRDPSTISEEFQAEYERFIPGNVLAEWAHKPAEPASPISNTKKPKYKDCFVEHLLQTITNSPNDWRLYHLAAVTLPQIGEELLAERLYLFGRLLLATERDYHHANLLDDLRAIDSLDSPGTESDEGWIYFVLSDFINPRIWKLAIGIRSTGKKVRLVYSDRMSIPDYMRSDFDDLHAVNHPFEIWRLIVKRPLAIHVFVGAVQGCLVPYAALLLAPSNSVVDYYDPADEEISPLKRLEEGSEVWRKFEFFARVSKVLHNHFPGICTRNLYAGKLGSIFQGVALNQKRILLPEPTWGKKPNVKKLSDYDNRFHVAFGGTFGYEQHPTCRWRFIYELCRKADFLDIDLHLYLMPWDDPKFKPYRDIAEENGRVHFHKAIAPLQWIEALAQYDAGLISISPRDQALLGQAVTKVDVSGCWANKFGDYLDADLYTVVDWATKFMSFVAKRYGIGQPAYPDTAFTREFWDEVKRNARASKPNLKEARWQFRANAQGSRLLKFYETLRVCKDRKI